MDKAKMLLATLTLVSTMPLLQAKNVKVASPDGSIVATLSDDGGKIRYSVECDGRALVLPSELALDIKGVKSATAIKKNKQLKNVVEQIVAPFYRQKEISMTYNGLTATFDNGVAVEFRAFDEGVAYRFVTDRKKDAEVIVTGETVSLNLPDDPTLYLPYTTKEDTPMAMAFQNIYHQTAASHAQDKLAFLPVTVDYGSDVKLTLLESDLESYPGMFVKTDTVSRSIQGVFAKYPSATDFKPRRRQEVVTSTEDFIARTEGVRTYPWRVMAITKDDAQMPTNNLVYALASPSRVADTSWISPGKVAWDWWNDWGLKGVSFKAGINTETYKYYIDFASKNGIEYVVLDEGWYAPASGDMLTVIPEIDLRELIDYGRQRKVGIVLWTVFNVLDSQLEEACKKYAEMGVKGFKVDFLDRDDQTAVEMTYRIADACARHKLFLDFHGIYKPTGINRTYPNVLNFEGVFGMEEVKWTKIEKDMPRYDVTFPFIRMMAGNVDYTPGAMRNASRNDWKAIYYNPMSMGTRCHQLASYIVHDSPFTMLCDAPTNYEAEQECVDFICSLPVVFDQTKVLSGKLGEYIVTARENGGRWYVGGLTDWTARDIKIDFSFLPAGVKYKAEMMVDGINADKQAQDYSHKTMTVDSSSSTTITLASGGGFAIKLMPVE